MSSAAGTRALVTGAGGFVGRHLCARLLADGWEVWGTVRPGAPAPVGVHRLEVDLADPVALRTRWVGRLPTSPSTSPPPAPGLVRRSARPPPS